MKDTMVRWVHESKCFVVDHKTLHGSGGNALKSIVNGLLFAFFPF